LATNSWVIACWITLTLTGFHIHHTASTVVDTGAIIIIGIRSAFSNILTVFNQKVGTNTRGKDKESDDGSQPKSAMIIVFFN
jgi:hypothetical protein